MAKSHKVTVKMLVLTGLALAISGIVTAGCSGGGSDAPTNTANSKYNDSGQTAADKIGADRAKAHKRLPPGTPQNQ